MDFSVRVGSLQEALEVLGRLPEFDPLLPEKHYTKRLANTDSHILIAETNSQLVGCKVGYDRFKDGSFYSWLGGVIPEFRRSGIAKALLDQQHNWAKQQGYESVRFKTMNRHKAMLIFSLKNGFEIFNVKTKGEIENNRIELIKYLS